MNPIGQQARPAFVDRVFQLTYWAAFRLAVLVWFVTRPKQAGYLVVIWHDGEALLIRNSYQELWTAGGGSAKRGESPAEAAAREAKEELGIAIPVSELRLAIEVEHVYRYRHDRVWIFAWHPPERPAVVIDNREVVEAAWFTPEMARTLPLIPHLKDYFAVSRPGQRAHLP